ncbi:hypothetical protein ACFL0M_04205 [Thermodesulfobacteriota bacterium]
MILRTKAYVFTAFFSAGVVLYLILPNFPGGYDFVQSFNIFRLDHNNFIFLMISFVFIAYMLTELADYAHRFMARVDWRTPKIGKILVSQGYISPDELHQALLEQDLRLGEILVQSGRITPQQREQALKYQQKKDKMIGEIFRELGYSTEEDLRWALNKMDRRLGKILREKRLLTDYDLACALSLKHCRIDNHGKIYDMQ